MSRQPRRAAPVKPRAELLKHAVELHTPAFLSPYFRRDVERAADVRYPLGCDSSTAIAA